MPAPPIPQRIAPLSWRRPAYLWTPLALIVAVGAPAALLQGDGPLAPTALIAGAGAYALALISLGAAWALGRAPRTRRDVVSHIVVAGGAAALAAPFALMQILRVVAEHENAGAGGAFTPAMALSMAPLALVLGLPIAFLSGLSFALIALARPRAGEKRDEDELRHAVQPFQ